MRTQHSCKSDSRGTLHSLLKIDPETASCSKGGSSLLQQVTAGSKAKQAQSKQATMAPGDGMAKSLDPRYNGGIAPAGGGSSKKKSGGRRRGSGRGGGGGGGGRGGGGGGGGGGGKTEQQRRWTRRRRQG